MSNSKKIRRLDTEIRTNGHVYKLYLRNDIVAVYSQFTTNGLLVGYELTEILTRPEEEIGGVKYSKRECYCPTSLWGVSGFTLLSRSTEEKINEKFKEFTNKVRERREKLYEKINNGRVHKQVEQGS